MKLLLCFLLPAALLQAQFDGKTSVTTQTIPDETAYDNRPMLRFKPNGEAFMIYSLEKGGFSIRHLDKKLGLTPNKDLNFPDLQHMDMVVLDDNTVVVLAKGKANYTTAPSMIADYNNIAYLMKIDKLGKVLFKTKVMGYEGFHAGSYFLCSYTGSGCLNYDGSKFSIFLETCGNFAENDEVEPDVHETDYFVQVDNSGNVISDSKQIWKTSHSSLIQLATDKSGKAFTLSIGDSYPFGLNYCAYDNNEQIAEELLYPIQDKLPSNDMYALAESTTDAGQIGSIQLDGGNVVTIIATIETEKMPIKTQQKDLLFISSSIDGKTITRKWISKTSSVDEAMPYLMPYNDKWLVIYHTPTEEYTLEGKAVMQLIDKEGNMVGKPYTSDLDIDWHSQFFTYPNGDIGWMCTGAYATDIKIYRVAQ